MTTSHAALLAHESSPHNHGSGQRFYSSNEYGNSSTCYHNDSSTSTTMAGAATGGSGMGRGLLQSQHPPGFHHPILTSTTSVNAAAAATTAFVATPTAISTTNPESATSRRGSISSNVSALTADTGVGDCGAGDQDQVHEQDRDRDRATMSGTSSRTGIKISPIAERSMDTMKRKREKERIASNSHSEVQEQVQALLERHDMPTSKATEICMPKSKTPSQPHDQEACPKKPTPDESQASRSSKKKQVQELQPSLKNHQQRICITSVDNGKQTYKTTSSKGSSSSTWSAMLTAQDISVKSSSVVLPESSSAKSTTHPNQHQDRPNTGITATSRIASTADSPGVETLREHNPKMVDSDKKDEVVVTVTKKPLKKLKKKKNEKVEHNNKTEDKIVVATTKIISKKVKKKLKNDDNKQIKKRGVTYLPVPPSSSTNHNITPGIDGGSKKDRSATSLTNDGSLQNKPAVSGPLPPPQSSELSSPNLSLLTAAEKKTLKAAPLLASAIQKDDSKSAPLPPSQSLTFVSSSSSPIPTQQKKIVKINFVKKINRLSHPTDSFHLNSLHCFVRQELLDVFVLSPGNSEKMEATRRVGLRCAYCGHLSKSKRKKGIDGVSGCQNMSSFYPKSVEDLYRSVCIWQRVHFPNCPYVPDKLKATYSLLKQQDLSRGKTKHWEDTARLMGLRNASDSDRKGIVYRPTKTITMIEQSNRHYL